jgi:hypothetical protein
LRLDGELAEALETLSDCWDRLAVEYPVIGPDLVRLALAAGQAGRAQEVAAAVTGVAFRNEVPWIRRSPSTSASAPHVTWPGPTPRCGRRASAAAATSPTAAPKAAGRA